MLLLLRPAQLFKHTTTTILSRPSLALQQQRQQGLTTMMASSEMSCQHVFCYGSLRPDDDSGMPWTEDAVQGMRAQPATVFGAKLYYDRYAALVFGDDKDRPNDENKVVGWVLTADHDLFQEKLRHFDQIEGYDPKDEAGSFYQRAVAPVQLGEKNLAKGGRPIGERDEVVLAYVYHKPSCDKKHRIPSGDWLKRPKEYR